MIHEEMERLVEQHTSALQHEKEHLFMNSTGHNQTAENLRASEELFRCIFENIGVGISVISPDMEILAMNPQMNEWFPHIDTSARPICYRTFNDPPGEGVCPYCPTHKTLQDGLVNESVADTPRGGEIRHYKIKSSPLRDKTGRTVAAIEMVTDITDSIRTQNKLQESKIRYQTVFENTGTAMLVINEDMTIARVNQEFEKLSGFGRADIEGRMTWMDFMVPEDIERMKAYHRTRRVDPSAAPSSYECRARNRQGAIRDIFLTAAMIPGTTMSVVSLIDISDRKRVLEALRRREDDLAEESHRLQEMNTALKVLLQQREEDRQEMEQRVIINVRKRILPYMEKLSHTFTRSIQEEYADIITTNLNDIVSPFMRTLTSAFLDLTPREIEVANLIREGKTTKDIAGLMNLSVRSVECYRDGIRKKLGLTNKKINLRTHMMSFTCNK